MQPLGLLVYEGFRISDELLSELTQWKVHVRLLLVWVSAWRFRAGCALQEIETESKLLWRLHKIETEKNMVFSLFLLFGAL